MVEGKESLGLRINFIEPLNKEELDMMFEKEVYPAVIRFPLSIEYLAGHGNHYSKLDESTYGVFYKIRLGEEDQIYSIIVDGKETKIVSTEIDESKNDAHFIDKEMARFKLSEYVDEIKGMLETEKALV